MPCTGANPPRNSVESLVRCEEWLAVLKWGREEEWSRNPVMAPVVARIRAGERAARAVWERAMRPGIDWEAKADIGEGR